MTTPPPPIARWTFLLLFVLMAVGMPALAALAFARQIVCWGWLTVIPLLAYGASVLSTRPGRLPRLPAALTSNSWPSRRAPWV